MFTLSVCLSICPFVMNMYCGKMADLIVVLFGMVGQVRWGPDPPVMGKYWGKWCGALVVQKQLNLLSHLGCQCEIGPRVVY